jgi:tetratricopeptide (TPR) repeat protein
MKKKVLIFPAVLCAVLAGFSGCNKDWSASELYEKGKLLYSYQSVEEALNFFEKAVSADPDFRQAYVMCAKCYFYLNREEAAVVVLEKVLRKYPRYVDANFWAGKVYYFLDNHGSAEGFLLKVIEEDSNHVDARYLLGDIYLEKGDLDKALFNYSEIETNLNIIALSKIKKGEIFASAGQKKKAADELSFIDRNKKALDPDVLNEAYNLILKLNNTESSNE